MNTDTTINPIPHAEQTVDTPFIDGDGDIWFEVIPDGFVCSPTLAEAREFAATFPRAIHALSTLKFVYGIDLFPAPICFSNRIHDPHPGCAGLDADTLFDRTQDALS